MSKSPDKGLGPNDFILFVKLVTTWTNFCASAEAQKFVQVVTNFTNKIKSLGPSPLSGDFDMSALVSSCEAVQDAASVEGG